MLNAIEQDFFLTYNVGQNADLIALVYSPDIRD
jgi:hypothetical protein